MILSDRMTEIITQFLKSGELQWTLDEAKEFKKLYQETFRSNVDLSCGLCTASCIKKVARYANIQA